jgi:hypothetical protein
MFGLDKHGWGAIHMNACLLVLIAAGVHLALNWRVFLSYIKRKAAGLNLKIEMAAALLITAIVVTGTVLQVPPFSSTTALNEKIKAYWEQGAPAGPAPHAEEFSVTRLASNIGLSVDEVTTALAQEGFVVRDPELSIGELAQQRGVAPSDLYSAIQKRYPNSVGRLRAGPGRGRGMGRGQGGRGPWHQWEGDGSESAVVQDLDGGHGAGRTGQPGRGPGWGRGRGGWGQGQGGGLRNDPAHAKIDRSGEDH